MGRPLEGGHKRRPCAVQAEPLQIPFCNGPWLVNPFSLSTAGSRFCPGSALGRHLMGSDEDRPTHLLCVVKCHAESTVWPDPSSRRGTPLREGWCRDLPETFAVSVAQAAAAAGLNSHPSSSIRCMITASLRANATLAFFVPARLASRMAQRLSGEQPCSGLVSMMWAAS